MMYDPEIPRFRIDTPADRVDFGEITHVELKKDAILAALAGPDSEVRSSPQMIEITEYAHPDHDSFRPIVFDGNDMPSPPDGEFRSRGHSPVQIPGDNVRHLGGGPKRIRSEEEMLAELEQIDDMYRGIR